MLALPTTPFEWKGFWDMAAHAFTAGGILVAGAWAYFNFLKSRTYYPRLAIDCSGIVIRREGNRNLFVPRLTVKHIGKTKIAFISEGSGYTLHFSDGESDDGSRTKWETDSQWHSVLYQHHWIEPDECIIEQYEAFGIPPWAALIRMQYRVLGSVRPFLREKPIEWNGAVVIDCTDPSTPRGGG